VTGAVTLVGRGFPAVGAALTWGSGLEDGFFVLEFLGRFIRRSRLRSSPRLLAPPGVNRGRVWETAVLLDSSCSDRSRLFAAPFWSGVVCRSGCICGCDVAFLVTYPARPLTAHVFHVNLPFLCSTPVNRVRGPPSLIPIFFSSWSRFLKVDRAVPDWFPEVELEALFFSCSVFEGSS